ncbi:uncharacterized protein [Pocillopora verrucosa]|uniref:uncharacterized protein n=1 Tax=Pocillopora verrucosa TaxID=203993 RepID=UPI0033426A41
MALFMGSHFEVSFGFQFYQNKMSPKEKNPFKVSTEFMETLICRLKFRTTILTSCGCFKFRKRDSLVIAARITFRSTYSKVAKPPTHLEGLAAQQVLRHPFEITHAILAEGSHTWPKMAVFHDEVEIEDFEYDEESETYFYPCPCGDQFEITKAELENGEDVARCPSCSLILKVIYDLEDFMVAEEVAAPAPVMQRA